MASVETQAARAETIRRMRETPRFLTVGQAAELLQVNRHTVYRAIRTGALKASKVGDGYRVSEADILEWVGYPA